eukprot:evm.model.scf_1811EXC.5 EVM.evm.TU.scf_1811EXC.5   scf_1811EXC:17098-17502(-)
MLKLLQHQLSTLDVLVELDCLVCARGFIFLLGTTSSAANPWYCFCIHKDAPFVAGDDIPVAVDQRIVRLVSIGQGCACECLPSTMHSSWLCPQNRYREQSISLLQPTFLATELIDSDVLQMPMHAQMPANVLCA